MKNSLQLYQNSIVEAFSKYEKVALTNAEEAYQREIERIRDDFEKKAKKVKEDLAMTEAFMNHLHTGASIGQATTSITIAELGAIISAKNVKQVIYQLLSKTLDVSTHELKPDQLQSFVEMVVRRHALLSLIDICLYCEMLLKKKVYHKLNINSLTAFLEDYLNERWS